MKTSKFSVEVLLLLIAAAPVLYFISLWNTLPVQIPIHFDAQGMPNNYGSKLVIAITLSVITLGTYLLLRFIPKSNTQLDAIASGKNFRKLRVIITLFFSITSFIIIEAVQKSELNITLFLSLVALFFALIGNYMGTIPSNRFIGIRTPWTLKSETVWKKTHYFIGRLWFVSGIILSILILAAPKHLRGIIFIAVIVLLAIYAVLYSYYIFVEEKKENKQGINDNSKISNPLFKDGSQQGGFYFFIFYFNPKDSRIIVPKQNKSLGFTLNFANPYTYLIIAVFAAAIIYSKHTK